MLMEQGALDFVHDNNDFNLFVYFMSSLMCFCHVCYSPLLYTTLICILQLQFWSELRVGYLQFVILLRNAKCAGG